MKKKAGVVILKRREWGCPKVFVTLNRVEKSMDMSIEEFAVALKKMVGVQITKNRLNKAIDMAIGKILSEMRESVAQVK